MPMNAQTITPADVARRAGVSRPTVSRALKSGDLRGVRDNFGQWRITEADADAWAATRSPVHADQRANSVPAQDTDSMNAQLEQAKIALAASEARADGLAARLADAQSDRDAWKMQAERLASEPRPAAVTAPVSLWQRIFGR